MKKYICALTGIAFIALLAGCEQKETTVNPPAENKTENNTTVVKPDNPDSTSTNTTVKESTTVTASPSP